MDIYSLKKFFASPFPIKVLPYLLLLFGFLGFLDSLYLTIQHYQHAIPPCTVGGCETVLTSSFATLWGIPVALLGAVFYGVMIILTGIYITIRHSGAKQSEAIESQRSYRAKALQDDKQNNSSRFARTIIISLFILCSLGLLAGIGLILIQAYVLHAWCYYCLFSELIDFLLFDTAWWLYNSAEDEIHR